MCWLIWTPNISVTIIENGKAVRKEQPKPPKRLVNIVRCKNPRCISSIEEECDQIFELEFSTANTAASTASRSCR